MKGVMSRLLVGLALLLGAVCAAQAVSVGEISRSVNGMRQLNSGNIVQQWPGAAPYYGPNQCEQQIANFQAQSGPGYTCSCPPGASSPVCTPNCTALLPSYQDNAGPTMSCSCPFADQVPVCTPLPCNALIAYYSQQNPGMVCSCPTGATVPVCVVPPPSCQDLLSGYQAQYPNYICSCPTGATTPYCRPKTCAERLPDALAAFQAQQGPGVPVNCNCPNPDAAVDPICSCGNTITGFHLISWRNNAGTQHGFGFWYVSTYGAVNVQTWSDLWTGEFVGSGSISGGTNFSGTVLAGATYNWWGSFAPDGSSGSGSYQLSGNLAPGDTWANQSGTWTSTKIANQTGQCSATPPCGSVLSAVSGAVSASGQVCSCPGGSSKLVPPACGYASCQPGQNVPTGQWNLTASTGTTCTMWVSPGYTAPDTIPALYVYGSCSDGTTLSNGSVACDATLGQNIVYGVTGTLVRSPDGSTYLMGGTFSGNSFSGFIEGTSVTFSGTHP